MKRWIPGVFSLFSVFFVAVGTCEEVTISTYYPSPYGSYTELQSQKIAVGDTNSDGAMNAADLPAESGDLHVARALILKPQSNLPTSNLSPGLLVFNRSDNTLYLYDGVIWVRVAGGRID